MSEGVRVREAREGDVPGIRDVFAATYGEDYPYQDFYDLRWLMRSVFTDDILMLVAEDEGDGRVLGTASVVFDIGAHSDLIGECGRLAVHPDARGRGVGKLLMEQRVEFIRDRLHLGLVENRCTHAYSQRISHAHGFEPVGFLPLKHRFTQRESVALFARHFGAGPTLRCNHPRVVPEAHALAHVALDHCGFPCDVIADDEAPAYPGGERFELSELTATGLPALVRIERGRVRNREVFGPMRLQYGFFKLTARRATYLVAREEGHGPDGPIAGAVGFIHDDNERTVRIFELIVRHDHAVRPLLEDLLERCRAWEVAYVEIDVSAHAPGMQRTLVELGFLPVAYVPAMVFHHVERLDVVRMARLFVPPELGPVSLTPRTQRVADLVMRGFHRQAVLPRIASTIERLALFAGLSSEQATRVAGACGVESFAAGERLFASGDPADRMFLVMDGGVSVSLLPGQAVGEVEPGESLGEVALLTGGPHSASATARATTTVATITRCGLETITRQRPDIGMQVYRNLALGLGRKLRRATSRVGSGRLDRP